MKIGEIVKKYREEHKLSISKFAEKVGISKGYISMLEREVNPRNSKPSSPTLVMVRKLAEGMDMDLDELIQMLDPDQSIKLQRRKDLFDSMPTETELTQSIQYRILKAYEDADPVTQEHVRLILKIDDTGK
jgi:repressor LexA